MSYCRPGPDKSLYVYRSADDDGDVWICHACPSIKAQPGRPPGGLYRAKSRAAMLAHLLVHKGKGWSSGEAIPRLEREISEEHKIGRQGGRHADED